MHSSCSVSIFKQRQTRPDDVCSVVPLELQGVHSLEAIARLRHADDLAPQCYTIDTFADGLQADVTTKHAGKEFLKGCDKCVRLRWWTLGALGRGLFRCRDEVYERSGTLQELLLQNGTFWKVSGRMPCRLVRRTQTRMQMEIVQVAKVGVSCLPVEL